LSRLGSLKSEKYLIFLYTGKKLTDILCQVIFKYHLLKPTVYLIDKDFNMKTVLTGLSLLLLCCLNSEVFADQVYTWTDKDGNMHITAEPPPKNAQVKDIIEYEPPPDKTVPDTEQRRHSEAETASSEPESDEVRQARKEAEKAREEAEIASAKAEELTKAAEKYIQTHSQNEYMRRAHQYQMRKAAEDAKAAQERARIAEEIAIEAEKKAKLAEENARDSDD
jgi:hypothetical protein